MADLRGYTLTFAGTTSLVTETCYSCGTLWAFSANFRADRMNDRKSFYCPNGHSQSYLAGQSDADKLRNSEARETALKDQLSAAIRDAETTRVALLRDRARFAKGICPCCNRSFENVRRHMATKHADYDITKVKQDVKFKCGCGRSFGSLQGMRVHQGHWRSQNWDRPEASRWDSHLTVVTS